MYMSVLKAMYVCTDARSEWRPEEGIWYPGAGIAVNCNLLDLGTGIQFPIFRNSSQCS